MTLLGPIAPVLKLDNNRLSKLILSATFPQEKYGSEGQQNVSIKIETGPVLKCERQEKSIVRIFSLRFRARFSQQQLTQK